MKIMNRDIEVMGWILEQKFMTVNQVVKVFWRGASEKNTEAYRRLIILQKEGCLKRSRNSFYRNVLYVVTGSGLRLLKSFGRDRGLCDVFDVDYSCYKHDLLVTDLRILFHEWGYTDWMSERILSKRGGLRRLPDGMIHHKGKYIAIEYESAGKSKDRYRDILIKYELDGQIDKVIFIVETPELVTKLSKEAMNYEKLYIVQLEELQKHQLDAQLKNFCERNTLRGLLEGRPEI